MSETHFHRMLRAKVTEVLDARRLSVAEGVCSNFDRYMHEVGYITGLQDALKIADDLERELD